MPLEPADTFPPLASTLASESDVEQKLLFPLLSNQRPFGLAVPSACIFTKSSIKAFTIGKGNSAKLYFPDYLVVFRGLPMLIVEAKSPNVIDLTEAAREARLYATEINSSFPSGLNPCKYCLTSNGLQTELRMSDSDALLHSFTLEEVHAGSKAFTATLEVILATELKRAAAAMQAKFKPHRFERALNLVGGTAARDEQIPYNQFGRLLTSRFHRLFNPSTWEDRRRIVEDAYVASLRRTRYIDEIDGLIRTSSPPSVAEAQLIDDTSHPKEITSRLIQPGELRNQILLLIGAVGSGKSTFVDYLQNVALAPELMKATTWVRLDLNEAPVSPGEIYNWCRESLIKGLRGAFPNVDLQTPEGLRRLYRNEVIEFDAFDGALFPRESMEYKTRFADLISNLRKDQAGTLKALERYLCTGRGNLLVVGLDNCDKRNRDEQLLMFQVAKWVQQEVRCLVILPLRMETFENHRHEPPLDTALKDLIFRIEPPPFQEVLTKRLNLVLATVKAESGSGNFSYQMPGGTVMLSYVKLERYLRMMMGSLFEYERYGRRIIVGLAGRDIRQAFEIFLEFCRSGYISETDIFQAQATGEHQFLNKAIIARVLLRTNRRFYDGDQSFVKNVFQCDPTEEVPDPFLRYNILSWLRHHRAERGPSGVRGLHRLATLASDLVAHGSNLESVLEQCHYLARSGCVLTEHLRTDTLTADDLIALTPAGHVHLQLAQSDPHYLATCAEDCWVPDLNFAQNMQRRMALTPYWKSLAWPVTLDSAWDLIINLKHHRKQMLAEDGPILSESNRHVWQLDLDRLADMVEREIMNDRAKFQSRSHHK